MQAGVKIVYAAHSVAPHRVGGMQFVARMHAEGLAARGWRVVLVHASPRDAAVPAPPPVMLEERWVPRQQRRRWRFRLPGHYSAELVAFSRQVDDLVRSESPDVVYAEGPVATATLERSTAERPPVLFHPHGVGPFQDQGRLIDNLKGRLLRPLFRAHAQRADAVISQGGLLRRLITERLGAPADRVHELPNAIAPEHCLAQPRQGRGDRRLLFVGRDEPAKGLRLLLDAVRRTPDALLDVVGTPPIRAFAASSQVRWHGVVRDRRVLSSLYDQASVLVLPSFSEGMPTVLLEAMGRGLPVVATRVGGIPALVQPGVTGWLVTPGSRRELLAAVRDALTVPQAQFDRMAVAAHQRVVGGHLTPQVCDSLSALLERLAGLRRRAGAEAGSSRPHVVPPAGGGG